MKLPEVGVPDDSAWNPYLDVTAHTGRNAVEMARAIPAGLDVAIDIETPSITDPFTIKCVTAAWAAEGATHVVLLDPTRRPDDANALRVIHARARHLILHNSPFDIPGLYASELITEEQIGKVMDTLVLAREAWPDTLERKGLEALARKVLGMEELSGALKMAQKASGLGSNEKWYREADIHMPSYRGGAMADTVVTLRLAHPVFEAAISRQLDHPFVKYGHTTRAGAAELVMRHQRVNRVMLRRAAHGLGVDLDYLDGYVERVEISREAYTNILTEAQCRPGVGLDVITKLDRDGALPPAWPRTPTGRLKSDKASMERLPNHPLAVAHTGLAHTGKILGYMEKVAARSRITGRLHPQWNVLGASATGRLSASEPELQQFTDEARPIIREQAGIHSIDWTTIEPALLGWLSRDWAFIDPFEAGADIYEPVMTAAGCIRKTAKVAVLAGMYGQGRAKLAAALGISMEAAEQLQRQMRSAMPLGSRHMGQVKQIATDHGVIMTVSGRVLPIPQFNGEYAVHKTVNYEIQGSCADLMYEAIDNAERAGVGDALLLTMHDELDVLSYANEEIARIMTTPPPALIERTGGRVPVIRIDNQYLGLSWRSC